MLAYSQENATYRNEFGIIECMTPKEEVKEYYMDYLFYGNVTTSRQMNTTTISLRIDCESDEPLALYSLSPNTSHRLAYNSLPTERRADHIAVQFDVQDDQLFLFTIAGQSNESDIPFEVTYAVYNGEVIHLPENDLVHLVGATYIFPDGARKI
jgi:hypothetical protein